MGRWRGLFAGVGFRALTVSVCVACYVPVAAVETSRVVRAGDGRYSVSATGEDVREAQVYSAAVHKARGYCKQRDGRRAKIETSSGTSQSDGMGAVATVTDTQRIYFRCELSKKAKRKKAKRRRKDEVAKSDSVDLSQHANLHGGAIGSVALERWADTATGLPFAEFRYTFDHGIVLSFVAQGLLDGSVSSHASITMVSESHGGTEFNTYSQMALEFNGVIVAALDTTWSVQRRPGGIVREMLEARLPIANLANPSQPLTGLVVRAGVFEATFTGDVLDRFLEFLRIAQSGQLAEPSAIAPSAIAP